jgi:hypothetical protein
MLLVTIKMVAAGLPLVYLSIGCELQNGSHPSGAVPRYTARFVPTVNFCHMHR